MKIRYFRATDTLYIEFRSGAISERKDLDENTLLEMDGQGQLCAITLEHASERTDIPRFSFEEVAA